MVRGPIAMRVIVSCGSVSRMRRISRCEGEDEGLKKRDVVDVGGFNRGCGRGEKSTGRRGVEEMFPSFPGA